MKLDPHIWKSNSKHQISSKLILTFVTYNAFQNCQKKVLEAFKKVLEAFKKVLEAFKKVLEALKKNLEA